VTTQEQQGERPAPPTAIDRAFDLLTVAVEADQPVTLSEAATRAGLPKPTAHRILRLLVNRGLLRQDAERAYAVGPRFYGLAGKALSEMQYVREAQEALQWLQSLTPETIHFAVLTGDLPVYVAKIESRRPYRMASTIGKPLKMHCTAIGKAVLAYLPPERQAAYLEPGRLERYTPNTITKPEALRSELDGIRVRGFAIDDSEETQDLRCVAAAVFDARAEVIGGLSVSAPTFHLSLDDALSLAPAVMTAGRMVSLALGATPQALPAAYGGVMPAALP
jgi:IclR family acetate operon transcriptional repressor